MKILEENIKNVDYMKRKIFIRKDIDNIIFKRAKNKKSDYNTVINALIKEAVFAELFWKTDIQNNL